MFDMVKTIKMNIYNIYTDTRKVSVIRFYDNSINLF